MNRREVRIEKFTNSTPYFGIRLTHEPTGICVKKEKCLSYFRDKLPLFKELEKKVEAYAKEKKSNKRES